VGQIEEQKGKIFISYRGKSIDSAQNEKSRNRNTAKLFLDSPYWS
jgi:hypothetical protein